MKKLLFLLFCFFVLSNITSAQIGGYSLYFDGSDDYISVPHCSNLNFTAFTVEAWIFPTGTDSKIFGKTAYGSAVPGFNLGYTSDYKLYFEIKQDWGSGYVSGSCSQTVSLNTWSHVAMSWSSGGYLKGYINGAEVFSLVSPSLSITNSNALVIGKAPWISPNQGAFKGRIDEVRVWNLIRTQTQIITNMHKELAGNESGLVVYYKMSNGSGSTVTDNQTNVTANTGTINGASWKTSGCFAGPRNCLDLDGTNDYVDFGSPAATRITDNMTISAWAKTSASDMSRDIITNQWKNNVSGFLLGILSSGKIHYAVSGPGSTMEGYDVNYTINDDKWHYIVVTFASGTIKTYVDGLLVDTHISTIKSIVYNSSISLNIGRDSNTGVEYWKGQIDEVSIWSVVLSDSVIKENMTRTLAGNETGLTAYYNFDFADGSVLYDITSNAINGTLTNMDPATDWVSSTAFNTWLGSESNAWSTAANWSRGSVPSSTDNIGIYKFTSLGSECSISGVPAFNNIIFSSTSSPTLNSNFTVNGNIILNKNISLNGYTITIGSSGNLVEGNYRISGTTGSITTSRTLNNISSSNIGGLGAIITTSANMGITTITRGHTVQGNSNSISRYYEITPANNSGLNATLVFNYNDNEMNGNTESNLKLFKSTDAGINWGLQDSSVTNTVNNTITLTGINGFSRWTAANYNSPMPVELISFTSKITGRDINLKWITGKETNNKGFEVERKNTTGEWMNIGFVNSRGTTGYATAYSFDDIKLNQGKYNYRLKQLDNNGNFSYYNLNGTLEIDTPSKFGLSQNYPNPFNPVTKIDFELPVDSKICIRVFDITGKEVLNLINNENRNAGYFTVTIDGSRLASGVYFYSLSSGSFTAVKKMILIK
jgi:large repetitive protein